MASSRLQELRSASAADPAKAAQFAATAQDVYTKEIARLARAHLADLDWFIPQVKKEQHRKRFLDFRGWLGGTHKRSNRIEGLIKALQQAGQVRVWLDIAC